MVRNNYWYKMNNDVGESHKTYININYKSLQTKKKKKNNENWTSNIEIVAVCFFYFLIVFDRSKTFRFTNGSINLRSLVFREY